MLLTRCKYEEEKCQGVEDIAHCYQLVVTHLFKQSAALDCFRFPSCDEVDTLARLPLEGLLLIIFNEVATYGRLTAILCRSCALQNWRLHN